MRIDHPDGGLAVLRSERAPRQYDALAPFSRPVRVMTAPSVIAGGGRSVPIFTRTVPAAGSTDDATSRTLPVTLTARSDTSAMSAFLSTNSWVR